MKNYYNFVLLLLVMLLTAGCEFDDYDYLEESDNYFDELNENALEFDEFLAITSSGFDSIRVDSNYCYEFEYYDSLTDECVFEVMCDEETDECERVDIIYDEFLLYLENKDYITQDFSISHHGSIEDIDLIVEFYINSNDNLELLMGSDIDEMSMSIWDEFSFLIPDSLRPDLRYFGIFTDGVDETLAYVSQRDYVENPHIWYLAVDYLDYTSQNKEEFYATLIHEFAHIFSLENSQLDYYYEYDCIYLTVDDWCFYENSYLNLFYEEFWKKELYEFHFNLVQELGSEEEAGYELYDSYPSYFVTQYAATNILEDFAESFMMYVLLSNNQIQNSPRVVSTQKIIFFNNFDELKEMRIQIRDNLEKLNKMN
ncbi:MAG: hypothetical protein LAT82_05195 [Nanoarchaeota archaeon]|nr:hypothetical protein [Nanoarchaeota archaeon]